MKTRVLSSLLAVVFTLFFSSIAGASSETEFPADWKNWTSVETTLTKVGALPGCDADVSGFPPISQETIATYCNVKQGGPGKVAILVNPAVMVNYKARNGHFINGPNMILHLVDMKLLFVTGHSGGNVSYGIFTEDGNDLGASSGPLDLAKCRACHTGYQAFCLNGQCGTTK